MLHSPWVGLDNFQRIFADSAFWDALQNTLVLFILQLVLYFPIPIMLALLINSVVRPQVRAVRRPILYLPHFFSWVLVIAVFQQMFGGAGLLSQLLREHGYNGLDIMTNPDTFKFLVTAQSVWKDAGWGIIVFLAALASVSPDLYEAAAMDGAGRWRRMWHVTLPGAAPGDRAAARPAGRRRADRRVRTDPAATRRRGAGRSEVLDTFVWWNGVATRTSATRPRPDWSRA